MSADSQTSPVLPYRGRFAPSPSGPLHMGSLIAAAASYLRARQKNGQWLLRIEDIDPPREVGGAADSIIRTLEAFGFEWDEAISYQNQHLQRYQEVLHDLAARNLAYPCRCSRRQVRELIEETAATPGIYPGTCKDLDLHHSLDCNWRLKIEPGSLLELDDLLQGHHSITTGSDIGDFIIWRKDRLPSYQLAVTVDDQDQGISEIVRGIDLLAETFEQNLLRQYLDYRLPDLLHIPVLVNSQGQKLSKRTGATAVDAGAANQQLIAAFAGLGLHPEPALSDAALPELWLWAIREWDYNVLKSKETIPPN